MTARAILVDGEPGDTLPVEDRGCMYGDGVFRTLMLRASGPRWWTDQLEKLRADAARLGIESPEAAAWSRDLKRLDWRGEAAVLKLVVTRGDGVRGYRPTAGARPRRALILSPLPGHLHTVRATGARVRLCDLRLGEQPRLAGIKHLGRLENVLARLEWDDDAIHEGLLLDAAGRLVSGVSSNLFILQDDRLLTPRLDRCGVAGVARDKVLAAASRLGVETRETELRMEDLFAAREVMLSNSLIGLWPVNSLGDHAWPSRHLADALFRELDA